jgi:hypothetical protein
VIAGTFDPAKYRFKNLSHEETLSDFRKVHKLLTRINPALKTLLTVSPVPLTATAAGHHVLQATTYSKSVLRAVCGILTEDADTIDYFPSYEIITAPFAKGAFFEENMRSVTPEGVATVMRIFFSEHGAATAEKNATAEGAPAPRKKGKGRATPQDTPPPRDKAARRKARMKDELQCEEVLLDAFADKADDTATATPDDTTGNGA